jgi:peptidoglycan lytic transglycosylase G
MRKTLWLLFIAVMAGAGWLIWALLSPITPSAQIFVMLHPGYSTRRIAHELKRAGVIRSEEAFLAWHYFHRGRSLKAGEYLFEKAANTEDVHQRLARGDVYFHTVVVPEGFTMFDIARAVEAAGLGKAEDFLKVAETDTALIADLAPGARSLEGFLFPDTYQFTRMDTMEGIAAAMVCQFHVVAQEIGLTSSSGREAVRGNPDTSSNKPHLCGLITVRITVQVRDVNSTADETTSDLERTVTMASIVEKETAVPEERPMVASVYYNRLAKKIALDADPSVIYAELLAGAYTGALHHDDMHVDSAYNTYTHAGLPPGPIANPGRSALEAAMHPAQSDYFYFVADAQGHHRFAKTIDEHNKNVAAYRKAMREAGAPVSR